MVPLVPPRSPWRSQLQDELGRRPPGEPPHGSQAQLREGALQPAPDQGETPDGPKNLEPVPSPAPPSPPWATLGFNRFSSEPKLERSFTPGAERAGPVRPMLWARSLPRVAAQSAEPESRARESQPQPEPELRGRRQSPEARRSGGGGGCGCDGDRSGSGLGCHLPGRALREGPQPQDPCPRPMYQYYACRSGPCGPLLTGPLDQESWGSPCLSGPVYLLQVLEQLGRADANKINFLASCPSQVGHPQGAEPGGGTKGRHFRSKAPEGFGGPWDTREGGCMEGQWNFRPGPPLAQGTRAAGSPSPRTCLSGLTSPFHPRLRPSVPRNAADSGAQRGCPPPRPPESSRTAPDELFVRAA
ncbi:basic salivary proline-rich protein 2-like [Ursus maritimus]|uniref:Basic salivary proline-rich protein 2-like n=1 Tax=Ursus maritimus TaxID=29073 RepID=A0A8M1GC85_URSMA|nr:basic salivary proline-rich protein 2-like [Ursus maritimus]